MSLFHYVIMAFTGPKVALQDLFGIAFITVAGRIVTDGVVFRKDWLHCKWMEPYPFS